MRFVILAWQPTGDGGRSAWRWYWRCEVWQDRVLVALMEQPYHEQCFETKSQAEAAAQAVIDAMTGVAAREVMEGIK